MKDTVQIQDAVFKKFISYEAIQQQIQQIAQQLNNDYRDKNPLLISILNGAFILTADLMKELYIPCEVSFLKLSSYKDMQSTGDVQKLIGLDQDIKDRHILIVEDIIDSGQTLASIHQRLKHHNPKSIEAISLFFKPASAPTSAKPKYLGFEIENKFIIGYGLDYNGHGRQLKDVYQLADT